MFRRLFDLIKLLFALFSFVSVFYIILEFAYFISYSKPVVRGKDDPWINLFGALFTDMLLLSLFVLQHSAMASRTFRRAVHTLGLYDITRSIYITATAAVLWTVIKYWQPTSHHILWNINPSNKQLRYAFTGIHVIAWIIIYVANICTDVPELLGLKQVYYKLMNLPEPIMMKSYRLQKLTAHMRHPSFLGFLLVFWLSPVMTIDRVLLATILTLYMYMAWNTDVQDYNYQKYMYQKKYHELKRLKVN
ncbi:nurim homolog [Dendroctonus ponderosae]|uniref:Nuclear envelope membrane protein n=1 Tax=Dendroctonus ponderosae TaxID=77166 RepID=J3JYC6_DENPD